MQPVGRLVEIVVAEPGAPPTTSPTRGPLLCWTAGDGAGGLARGGLNGADAEAGCAEDAADVEVGLCGVDPDVAEVFEA